MPVSSSSTRGAPRRLAARTPGWASTPAPTSRSRTRSLARSSTPGSSTSRSSNEQRWGSTRTRRRSSRGPSNEARWRPASPRTPSVSSLTPTPRPTRRSCAGRSASPSTTTRSTTCSRSSTSPCSPAMWAARAAGCHLSAGRTTCRAAATWARSRTSCPASKTSWTTTRPARRFDAAYGAAVPPRYGMHLSAMFEAMDRGELRALYVMGENPAESEADVLHARHLLESLDLLVVQDLFLTQTARARRRRAPCGGGLVRGRGHRDQQRAARAAGAESGRAARRGARRPLDPDRGRPMPRPRLAGAGRGSGVGRGAIAVADASGDELRAARGAGWDPMAVLLGR